MCLAKMPYHHQTDETQYSYYAPHIRENIRAKGFTISRELDVERSVLAVRYDTRWELLKYVDFWTTLACTTY